MADDAVKLNTRPLDKLIKALKGDMPMARVGVLGDKDARSKGNATSNATIGAKHEFGDPAENLPMRSFLRVPISENMQPALDNSQAFDKDAAKKVIETGSIVEWVKKLGVLAEGIVADAFATGGFGKWKPSNMENKKNQQTLVETQQLRNSITSDVKE